MIKDSLGTSEHRLAILVSGGPDHTGGKLLAVPTIADGTGLAQAEATATALDDWGVSDNVVGLCYDTTSSNTGRLKGAVVKLEAMLEKSCFGSNVVTTCSSSCWEPSLLRCLAPPGGPVDTKFQDLKRRWPQLDTSEMRFLFIEDSWLQELRDAIIEQLQAMLARPGKDHLCRDLQRLRDVNQPTADQPRCRGATTPHSLPPAADGGAEPAASDAVGEGERQALAEALLSQPESADPEDAALCLRDTPTS
ncbi:hypothetical protein FJT64_027155 [Amphibalanus amphitrite]|uniref:Uncharacterized protein n=1 Tax=Amphibalanus amphitrite TaxID=1232801 RepID=A0A6A4WE70_AMPAM|nr:hypothetical protein FJT64_027155 [Amphibalanus amphitrite]